MKLYKRPILVRLFCVLMALHIFNISVDTPDAEPDFKPEDLSYNDMESVVEIILEKYLGYDDAIAEHDEPDDGSDKCTNIEIDKDLCVTDFYAGNFSISVPYDILTIEVPYNTACASDYISEITPPPPKC